jgi:serine/threonine-protein kinase
MYGSPFHLLVILATMSAEKFSRYMIREELGVGGMATVYRAYDPMFEREVALKILKKELLEDPQVRERFERETKIIARLEHPAIVPVYDVGFDNGQMFYVMRYMPGRSLSERIEGGLGLNEIAYIILRIGAALDYAPRPETRQHPLRRKRQPLHLRLRHCQGGTGRHAHHQLRHYRYAALYESRTGQGR